MKRLDISVVFKVTSVEDLGNLYKALDQTMTLQEKVKLEKEIMKLQQEKKHADLQLKEIRDRIRELCPGKTLPDDEETDKTPEPMPQLEEASEEDGLSLNAGDERFIVEGTNEATQEREVEGNVESDQRTEA